FFFFLCFLLLKLPPSTCSQDNVSILMAIKASLDPQNLILNSWSPNATDPCMPSSSSFEGIACDGFGQVVNISLQGKRLAGEIPPEIGQLKALSGLYLHFNELHGVIPREIADLNALTDLYLDVNNLTGDIPPEIGAMPNLQVLQLCYNKLTGNIPSQLGQLKNLTVLALQSNQLSGAIPATLGELASLTRLDLSFNRLFGSIPLALSTLSSLKIFDITNNTLSGNVPQALKGLGVGFQYSNNPDLCGNGYPSLLTCSKSSENSMNQQPFGTDPIHPPSKDIPESANVQRNQKKQAQNSQPIVVFSILSLLLVLGAIGVFTFTRYRRRKQKVAAGYGSSDNRQSTDRIIEAGRNNVSPLVGLEYSNDWDPLAKREEISTLSQEILESYMFNLDEIESATQYFSGANILGKGSFSAIYKGCLRDGSLVAIKCISKVSCRFDADEFLKGLKLLISLKHENLLRLRGFCCSKDRGECFLIYDYVANGNLSEYLDVKGQEKVLDWNTRKSIIRGIAKGMEYLHGSQNSRPKLVHRNISAEKILIDKDYNPLLSDSGLFKLLADDIVFSTLKGSAAMGYLAPEYTTTGRFTEKSDVYAFGMIIFQILSGKTRITQLNAHGAELSRFEDFIDANLSGNFVETEATRLGEVALLCTHELPDRRPDIGTLMQEL
ncbi:hypothetical protein M569_01401, partial [Genlisea aurea]